MIFEQTSCSLMYQAMQSQNFLNTPYILHGSATYGLSFCGIMAKVLDCGLKVSEFQLQFRYYILFQPSTFEKDMNILYPYPLSYGLNSIIAIFLLGWLWH